VVYTSQLVYGVTPRELLVRGASVYGKPLHLEELVQKGSLMKRDSTPH
jgi:hypothetical protein